MRSKKRHEELRYTYILGAQEHKGAVPGEATALANETNLGKARDQGKHDIFPQYTALQQPVIRRLPEPKVGFGYSTALRILMKENELWT